MVLIILLSFHLTAYLTFFPFNLFWIKDITTSLDHRSNLHRGLFLIQTKEGSMNQAHKAWATKKLYVFGNESQWWTPFAAPSGTISLHSVQPSAGSTSPPLRLPSTLISSQGAPSFSISSSCSVRMVRSTCHRMSSTAALSRWLISSFRASSLHILTCTGRVCCVMLNV